VRQSLLREAFIGRARELAELHAGLEDVQAGHGRLFLISGEPGIGKTRLAEQLSTQAGAQGASVAWGRCWEEGGAPAYWPWIQIFRSCLSNSGHRPSDLMPDAESLQVVDLVPEMFDGNGARTSKPPTLASCDPERERFKFFDSAARLLKKLSSTRLLVIFIDDLQAADEPSLQMLAFVARELKGDRVMLIGTYRDNEIRSSPIVSRLFANLVREGMQLPLYGLSPREIEEYLNQHATFEFDSDLIDALSQVTGGNPLFLDGIVRTLRVERRGGHDGAGSPADFSIPHGVREAIRTRLNSLSAEANLLLKIGSVIGKEFELNCIQRLDCSPLARLLGSIDELMHDGITIALNASQLNFRFAHDLIRETIYKDIPTAERLKLHQRVAEVMEDIHQSNLTPHVADLAYHYCSAASLGNSAKAIDYSIRAGQAALAVFAYEDSVSHWRTALQLMEEYQTDPELRADLLNRLGNLLFSTGSDHAKEIEYQQAALEIYETRQCTERVAQIHANLGNSYSSFGGAGADAIMDIPKALQHYGAAEKLLKYRPVTLLSGEVSLGLSGCHIWGAQTHSGLVASQRAMQIAEKLQDDSLWARAAEFHSMHLFAAGRLKEGRRLIETAWKAANRAGDYQTCLSVAWVWGDRERWLGDPVGAERWYRRELSRPARTRPAGQRRRLLERLGIALIWAGELKQTRSLSSEIGQSDFLDGLVAFWRADFEKAESCFMRLIQEMQRACDRVCESSFQYWLARIRLVQGDHVGAESLLQKSLDTAIGEPGSQHLPLEMWIRPHLASLYVHMGRCEDALPHIIRCREIIAAGEDWRGLLGGVALAEAVAAAANNKFDEAERRFEEAFRILDTYSLCFEKAETLYWWGCALNAAGEHVRATEKFEAAAEVHRNCGAAERWIKRALAAKPSLQSASLVQPSGAADLDATFRKNDDNWTISFAGKTSQMRDGKGLRYLACLLRSPSTEFGAIDLANDQATNIGNTATVSLSDFAENGIEIRSDLDGAAPALDLRARSEYRQRLVDLKEELEAAERHNDPGRKERLLSEIDALMEELKTRFGRGKDLKAALHRDRARSTVSKRIRFALDQIRQANPALAKHLTDSIRTGYNCVYRPKQNINWNL
jgi:tetratricopeptide (TPR) repeat protein